MKMKMKMRWRWRKKVQELNYKAPKFRHFSAQFYCERRFAGERLIILGGRASRGRDTHLCWGTYRGWYRIETALPLQPDALGKAMEFEKNFWPNVSHRDQHFLLWAHKIGVARYVDTSSGQFTSHLPYRVLPPGSVKMLWVQSGGKCSYLGATRHTAAHETR